MFRIINKEEKKAHHCRLKVEITNTKKNILLAKVKNEAHEHKTEETFAKQNPFNNPTKSTNFLSNNAKLTINNGKCSLSRNGKEIFYWIM